VSASAGANSSASASASASGNRSRRENARGSGGDDDFFRVEFELREEFKGCLIGRRGAKINGIRHESGADVILSRHGFGVTIYGTKSQIRKAQELIVRCLQGVSYEGVRDVVFGARVVAPAPSRAEQNHEPRPETQMVRLFVRSVRYFDRLPANTTEANVERAFWRHGYSVRDIEFRTVTRVAFVTVDRRTCDDILGRNDLDPRVRIRDVPVVIERARQQTLRPRHEWYSERTRNNERERERERERDRDHESSRDNRDHETHERERDRDPNYSDGSARDRRTYHQSGGPSTAHASPRDRSRQADHRQVALRGADRHPPVRDRSGGMGDHAGGGGGGGGGGNRGGNSGGNSGTRANANSGTSANRSINGQLSSREAAMALYDYLALKKDGRRIKEGHLAPFFEKCPGAKEHIGTGPTTVSFCMTHQDLLRIEYDNDGDLVILHTPRILTSLWGHGHEHETAILFLYGPDGLKQGDVNQFVMSGSERPEKIEPAIVRVLESAEPEVIKSFPGFTVDYGEARVAKIAKEDLMRRHENPGITDISFAVHLTPDIRAAGWRTRATSKFLISFHNDRTKEKTFRFKRVLEQMQHEYSRAAGLPSPPPSPLPSPVPHDMGADIPAVPLPGVASESASGAASESASGAASGASSDEQPSLEALRQQKLDELLEIERQMGTATSGQIDRLSGHRATDREGTATSGQKRKHVVTLRSGEPSACTTNATGGRAKSAKLDSSLSSRR